MSHAPFVDPEGGGLDSEQIIMELIPLGRLVLSFVALAAVPFALQLLARPNSGYRILMTVLTQVIIAIGSGIVLMYVIARGIQLADRGDDA